MSAVLGDSALFPFSQSRFILFWGVEVSQRLEGGINVCQFIGGDELRGDFRKQIPQAQAIFRQQVRYHSANLGPINSGQRMLLLAHLGNRDVV